MLRTLLVLAFAATLILAGCGGDDDELSGDVSMPLVSQNDSGQDGEATLSEVDSETTRVVLEVENPSVEPQPAHIHRGSCENLDPEPAYGLENVVDGKSTTEVNVAVEDLVDKGFAINVHKSADEVQVYVACGDIEDVAQVNPPQD
jgi:uncharacterized lipoprotein YajG